MPSPFRPTPLQAKQLHDYWSIDLINWPDIRDQIMLEQNQCDYDALIKDTILHSVIEQPHLGVAVGVMDIFQNQIQRRDKRRGSQATSTRNYLNDPSWTFFELGPEAQTLYLTAVDPVEEALVSELERRMRDDAPVGCHSQDAIASPAEAIRGGNEVALFFGLDDMVGWKLSKEFATKYPFLDCSTGKLKTTSTFPYINESQLIRVAQPYPLAKWHPLPRYLVGSLRRAGSTGPGWGTGIFSSRRI